MNKEKQIEEMTKITCQMYRREKEKKCAGVQECDCKCLHYNRCEALYNLGYRKASEVAREILEPIIGALRYTRFASPLEKQGTLDYIYSIANKYTEVTE